MSTDYYRQSRSEMLSFIPANIKTLLDIGCGEGNFLALVKKERGVETLIKDSIPTHWQKGLNLSKFHLPNSEKLAKEVISLPMYPELTNEQINYVINCVREFYLPR